MLHPLGVNSSKQRQWGEILLSLSSYLAGIHAQDVGYSLLSRAVSSGQASCLLDEFFNCSTGR